MSEPSLRHHVTHEMPWKSFGIDVDILTDNNAATACVSLHRVYGPALYATGSSKRSPEDRQIPEIGNTVALGRALIALGQHLTATAEQALDS